MCFPSLVLNSFYTLKQFSCMIVKKIHIQRKFWEFLPKNAFCSKKIQNFRIQKISNFRKWTFRSKQLKNLIFYLSKIKFSFKSNVPEFVRTINRDQSKSQFRQKKGVARFCHLTCNRFFSDEILRKLNWKTPLCRLFF